MKTALACVIASISGTAFGLPLVYDGFDYPLVSPAPIYTNLVGQVTNNGPNWFYAGPDNSTDIQPYVYPGSLSYPPLAPSTGNSVAFGNRAGGGMAARLNLPSIVSSGTLYYSFILKLTDITALSTSGIFWIGFNNQPNAQTTLPSVVVTRLDTRADGDGFNIGLDKSSGGAANFQWYPDNVTPTRFQTNDVIFIVGSYVFGPDPVANDSVSYMWVNPDPSDFALDTPPPAPLTNTVGNDINGNQIASFCLFNRSTAEPHGIVLDELRVGTTWADVTPTANSMAIINQPKDARIIEGANASFSVTAYLATTYQWQHNGVDIAGATTTSLTITNAQLSDAGSYDVVVGNGVATPLTSSNAVLTVNVDTYPRLSPLWSIAPGSRPYITTEPSQIPMQRYFAYNALSNQVLIVGRTNTDTLASTGMVYVLDASSGADLYQMDANSGIIIGGYNGITLNTIDVADDGSVYAANISDLASTTPFSLYRWESSSPDAFPANVFTGFPFGGGSERYGDSLAVRGSDVNTQVLLDDSRGLYGVILRPTDPSMTAFYSNGGQFTNVVGGLTGGRTIFFADTNEFGPDSFWEHHRGGALNLASFDLSTVSSTLITNYNNFPSTMGVCDFNLSLNLLCGINFLDDPSMPDTLDLYDISDLSQPTYIASYDFPVDYQPNANRCGRVIFSGDRVWALDANNGFLAFQVVPRLSIASSGADLLLSWPTNFTGFTLTASPSLSSPVTFTNVSSGSVVGNQYVVTNAIPTGSLYYRLMK